MAKAKIPNQRNEYKRLNKRLNIYVANVQSVFELLSLEAARAAVKSEYDGSAPFRFDSSNDLKKKVKSIKSMYVSEIGGIIHKGINAEWAEGNRAMDNVVKGALRSYYAQVDGKYYKHYYQENGPAKKAFMARKDRGMGISDKLWSQAENLKEELEYAISTAIDKGTSAVTLSKRLSKYLLDFEKLKKDYKEKFGTAVECYDCEYRSIRLARSEINMAYRTASQERWKQLDFVVGYEIKLSGSHPHEDICDTLAGKYPKEFKWTGWHPNDLCYTVPILKTEDEFWEGDERLAKGKEPLYESVNKVDNVPMNFKSMVNEDREEIEKAIKKGTAAYYLKDNVRILHNIWDSEPYFTTKGELSIEDIIKLGVFANKDIITERIFSSNLQYNLSRQELHNNIIEEYLARGGHTGSDVVYMLGGGPANGKSTLVNSGRLNHPAGSLVIDADEVKAMIPEYGIMVNSGNSGLISSAANFVHEESSLLGKMIQQEALNRDLTIVIDGVNDGAYAKVSKKVNAIRDKYHKRIRADYVSLDTEKSLRYAQARAEKTGRKVPTEFIVEANAGVSKIIPEAIDNALFDELYLWDTNETGNPRLILTQIDGKLTIHNKKLYRRFLDKASVK